MAIVYGSPDRSLQQKLWRDLGQSQCNIQEPWIAIGDFNTVTYKEEVSSPGTYADQRSKDFNDWINSEALIDLGYTGKHFTWKRGKSASTFKGARLDRGLCSVEWLDLFPNTKITHLPYLSSDHTPLLLKLDRSTNTCNNGIRFRFQAAWTIHDDFPEIVANAWKKEGMFQDKVNATRDALVKWNTESFGNIHKRKRRLEARLEGLQRHLEVKRSNNLIKLETKIRKELEDVLHQEELLWIQ